MKVLIISLKRMGDVILTTPAIRKLAQAIPGVQIDFMVYKEFASILESNPNIKNVLIYPRHKPWRLPEMVRREKYDWVVDFLTTGASSWASFLSKSSRRLAYRNSHPGFIHNIQVNPPSKNKYSALVKMELVEHIIKAARSNGVKPASDVWRPDFAVGQAKLDYWKDVLANSGAIKSGSPLVMLSPVSRHASRRWRLDGFAQVAKQLAMHDKAQVICLWGPGEKEQAQAVVKQADHRNVRLAPSFASLTDLAAYISHASCLITNCNGTRHIAVAREVPTLTIHMSTDPVAWNPPGANEGEFHPKHPIARKEKLFCIGCSKNTCPYNLECSSLLTADSVYWQARQLLIPQKP